MKTAIILLFSFFFLFAFALLPLPIPPYLDFQVIYHADMGLLRGIPLYDHAGQVNMIAQLANVQPEQVYVLPFPYPPWYALAALPLALLPISIAARVWFELNLIMLLASAALLTDGWPPLKRSLTGLAAFFFLPVLGTLGVGQYVLPVLLGASLWIYAVRNEKGWLVAIASALMTFKPHLGALMLLAGIVYLVLRRDEFGRCTLVYTLAGGVILFSLGFLADRAWLLDYFHSLMAFQQDSGVVSCDLCASLPTGILRLVHHPTAFASAITLGLGIFFILLVLLFLKRRSLVDHPTEMILFPIFVTLLASPYLLNYDFVLLLVPFFVLMERKRQPFDWLLLGLAYLLPFVSFGLLGRQGNLAFSISTLVLFGVYYHDIRQLDVSEGAAYNPTTIT